MKSSVQVIWLKAKRSNYSMAIALLHLKAILVKKACLRMKYQKSALDKDERQCTYIDNIERRLLVILDLRDFDTSSQASFLSYTL